MRALHRMMLKAIRLLPVCLLTIAGAACGSDDSPEDLGTSESALAADESFSFLAVADIHYGIDEREQYQTFAQGPGLDTDAWNRAQVDAFNAIKTPAVRDRLVDKHYAPTPKGLLVLGDLTDDGQPGQWASFEATFGLNGDRRLEFPVYETPGNHDYPSVGTGESFDDAGDLHVFRGITARNATRRNVRMVASGQRGHYAWKWRDVVFVNLGVKVSNNEDSEVIKDDDVFRRTPPFHSLKFLREVLANQALVKGDTKIVLGLHYPLRNESRFAAAERAALHDAIKGRKVIAIIHGHTHTTAVSKWCGVPVFNVGSPLMSWGSDKRLGYKSAFAMFDIGPKKLKAMTVSWNHDDLAASKDLKLGGNCAYVNGDRCWSVEYKLADLRVDRSCNP
jgi:predicted phosphodiesterase